MREQLVIYVDVDDTLIRSFGPKRIPIDRMVDHVRNLHQRGVELYCWSSAGAEYARATAAELNLSDCFAGYLPKPNVLIDDQPLATWRRFVALHPNEAASKDVAEYAALLRH